MLTQSHFSWLCLVLVGYQIGLKVTQTHGVVNIITGVLNILTATIWWKKKMMEETMFVK